MEGTSTDTVIKDSKGVLVGDGGQQTNNFITEIHHNYGASVPPNLTLSNKPEIDPELAIAYYDRIAIFPILAAEFSLHKVSTVFLMGGKQDWHNGLWDRIKYHLDFHLNVTASYANVSWSQKKSNEQRALFTCWHETVTGFSQPSKSSIKEIQEDITAYILDLSMKQPHSRVIVRYDIRDLNWNETNQLHLQSLVNDWQILHETLHKDNKNTVSIVLIFCVVEEPENVIRKILRLCGKHTLSHEEHEFETYKYLIEDYPKAFFCALPCVTVDEIDEWVETLKAGLAEGCHDASWWNDLKVTMRAQLGQYKRSVKHKQLRNDLQNNEKFIQAWRGKID